MGRKLLIVLMFLWSMPSLAQEGSSVIRFGWSSHIDSPQAVVFRALDQFGEALSHNATDLSFRRKGSNWISLSDRNSRVLAAKRHIGASFEYRLTFIVSDPKYLESEWTIEVQSFQGVLYQAVLNLFEADAKQIAVVESGQDISTLRDSVRFINLGDRFILLIGERYLILLQQTLNDFVRKPWFQFSLFPTRLFYDSSPCERQLEVF